MSLNSRVVFQAISELESALDLETPGSDLKYVKSFTLANGSGASQANKKFSDQRTLAASATEDLDLAGVLLDALGNVLTFARVVALAIYAAPANTNDVEVGGSVANGFATPFGDPTDVVKVKPGGLLVLVAPDATAYAVTVGTGDLLKITNGGAGTSVTYDVVILGS